MSLSCPSIRASLATSSTGKYYNHVNLLTIIHKLENYVLPISLLKPVIRLMHPESYIEVQPTSASVVSI